MDQSLKNIEKFDIKPEFTDVISYETIELPEKKAYMDQRHNKLIEFSKKLDLVASIEHPSPEWKKKKKKNIGWIEALDDPIAYAKANNYNMKISKNNINITINAQDIHKLEKISTNITASNQAVDLKLVDIDKSVGKNKGVGR